MVRITANVMVRFRVSVIGTVRSRTRISVNVKVMFRFRVSVMVRTRALVMVMVSDWFFGCTV